MDIRVTMTQNDQERKFQLPVEISSCQKVYSDAKQALISPVAHKIFGFPWAQEVLVGTNFVQVTKQDWVDWDVLEEPLVGLMAEHFKTYEGGPIEENPQPAKPTESAFASTPEAQTIAMLFENEVNPSLASHGGFVTLKGIEGDKAYVAMGGGCQGCAMSYMTLKEGIETAIKQAVPSIKEVIDVTNHEQGENPFYTEPVS